MADVGPDSGMVRAPYLAAPLRLEPFRAISLAPSRIGDPASARLYARPYRGVSQRIATWVARGDLREHERPALFLHEYTAAGVTVRGVVGVLDVSRRTDDPTGSAVLPHEGVRTAQAEQLATRMRQMRVHPAPILLVYHAPPSVPALLDRVQSAPPDEQYDDHGGQHHRLWAITDPDSVSSLQDAWAGLQAVIADGHHRYAAYVDVQDRSPGTADDFGLAMLIDHDDTPLHLGAIHRVLVGTSLRDLRAAANRLGLGWSPTSRESALARLAPGTLALSDGRGWAVLQLGSGGRVSDEPGEDVGVLHHRLLPALRRQPSRIVHAHQVDGALKRARPGRDVAVLLSAPTFDAIMSSAAAGRLLPEKATSFQPKPHPGVLIRLLDAARPSR